MNFTGQDDKGGSALRSRGLRTEAAHAVPKIGGKAGSSSGFGKRPLPIHLMMVGPVLALIGLFLLLPALYVFWLSLTESTYGMDPRFVGFSNYFAIFSDPVFWRAAWNTFFMVNGIVYAELFLGLALALCLAGRFPFKKTIISILIAPYAVTEVTAVLVWRYMFEPDVGMASHALQSLFGAQLDWGINPVHGMLLASILAVWINLPFTFLILYVAVQTVPNDLVEAATVDGASPFRVFLHVVLPTIMPAILIAILFRYIFALRLFSEVWLLTQGGPAQMTEVLSVYLFRQAFRFQEFGIAAATGWSMVVISLLIASYYLQQLYVRMLRDAS